ncbi:hypothetical protein MSG28_005925 [Choristoneura fumiferana]|uniref:Uncharacterized protein n=1 Tax=Choristoneura fumiferana TaxID=7141 RepID=A0ACC0L250_CHOFU|nr:hypothetical protein MSG28_005925 [Choristoneura fumiferana]
MSPAVKKRRWKKKFDLIQNYKEILQHMKPKETIAKSLQRLGATSNISSAERWKRKKAGIVDEGSKTVTRVTELANQILTKMGNMDIYQETYEKISAILSKHASKKDNADLDMYADDFDQKEKKNLDKDQGGSETTKTENEEDDDEVTKEVRWEFKWKQDDNAELSGPHSTEQMHKWANEGYFKTGVWVRKHGVDSQFYSSNRTDFELYIMSKQGGEDDIVSVVSDRSEECVASGEERNSRRHLSGSDGQSESSSSSEDDEGSSSLPPNKRRRCDRGYVPVDPRVDSLVNQTDSDDKKVVPPANEERLRKVTKLQHFNTQAWKGLKYKSILQGFSATPGFVALKVNEEFTHFKATKDFLASAENMLAGLTNAELEHEELLRGGLQELINWAARNPSELNPASLLEKATSLLGPGSPLHKCSERKMQVICGRRGECIEIRRERILKEVNNINLKTSLREIPPSAEYLFSRDALQPLIQSLGGFHTWLNRPSYIKEKGQSRDRSSTYKQDRRNRNNGQENRNPGQDNKAKQGGSQTFQKRNNFRNKGNYTGKKNFTNQDKQKGRIPFKKKPPLQHLTQNMLNRFTTRTSPEMSAIIKDLKEKAVLEVPPVLNSSFLSKMFLIKKADGSMRPIFDLRGLNQYVATKHFQLVSQLDVADFLQMNDWMTKIDLHQAYFHLPIAETHRRFLRVYYNQEVLQLTALPFGLSSAPRTFAAVSNWIAEFLRKRGIRLLVYLDDYILANQDKDKLAEQVVETLSTLENLGWQVNYQKSVLTPTQQLEYLGLSWNTQQVTMALPISKVQKPNNTPRAATLPSNPEIPKEPNELQTKREETSTPLSSDGVTLVAKGHRQQLSGDAPKGNAADTGWGAHLNETYLTGRWSRNQRSWHSNLKELYAVYGAISRHQQRLGNAHILVQSDNRTLVAYIRNEGGTRSLALLELTTKLLELTSQLNVTISAAYLPGRYNGIADRLSRNRPVPEWHLLPPASEAVFRIWGVPEVDLFASSESAVVDRYVTWDSRDGSAIFCDAFSRPWKFKLAWVFPPPNLIPRVLRHLNMAVGTYIVIAPHWMQCFWLADLRARALAEPYPIHNLHNNLIDLTTGRAPPQIIKAISLTRPQEKKVGIWDTKLLFDWLRDTPSTDRLFDVSRRTAIVLLLASGRRVHDLTLLDIAEDSFFENRDNELELWPRFGSKTDSGKSRQSGKLTFHMQLCNCLGKYTHQARLECRCGRRLPKTAGLAPSPGPGSRSKAASCPGHVFTVNVEIEKIILAERRHAMDCEKKATESAELWSILGTAGKNGENGPKRNDDKDNT